MKALIIVDVQNDFLSGGSLAVSQGDAVIEPINQIQSYFDCVVATQDWHPEDHIGFAKQHPSKKAFDTVKLPNGIEQTLWPVHCVQGSFGAALSKKLKLEKVNAIFRKGMNKSIDSYSAFFDNQQEENTGLAAYLKAKQIVDVYLCGLAGDYCVFYSAKDATKEGFRVFFLEDAVRNINGESYAKAHKEMQTLGINFLKTNDFLSSLKR